MAKFHLVLEGSALLFSEAGSVTLAAGDLAVLPHGSAHTLADGRDSRPRRHRWSASLPTTLWTAGHGFVTAAPVR